jgi:hypothetical protein
VLRRPLASSNRPHLEASQLGKLVLRRTSEVSRPFKSTNHGGAQYSAFRMMAARGWIRMVQVPEFKWSAGPISSPGEGRSSAPTGIGIRFTRTSINAAKFEPQLLVNYPKLIRIPPR